MLRDPRVIELWDERKILGRWYGRHPDYVGGNRVYWDAYLLYGPASRWLDQPTDLVSRGTTIVRRREQLRRDLRQLIQR